MDGRRVAMNVLVGAGIGASVPIVAAIALVLSVEYFDPIEHLSSLIILSTLCAGIGVLVNLPWDIDANPAANPAMRSKPRQAGDLGDDYAERARRYQFDAGFDEPLKEDHAEDQAEAKSQRKRAHSSASGRGPRGNFTMSHRRALTLLGVDDGANDETVRDAYRQLAKQIHPDQFVKEGEAAVTKATEDFRELQEAYRLVRSNG